MSSQKPHYELVRVFEDGTEEEPEIIPITDLPFDAQMNRRGFLGAAISTAAALALFIAAEDEADGGTQRRRKRKRQNSYRPGSHRRGTVHRRPTRSGVTTYSVCRCNKVCVCIPIG